MSKLCDACNTEFHGEGFHLCFQLRKKYKIIKKLSSYKDGKLHGWDVTFDHLGKLKKKIMYEHGKFVFLEEFDLNPESLFGTPLNKILKGTITKIENRYYQHTTSAVKDVSFLWVSGSGNKDRWGYYANYVFDIEGCIKGIDAHYFINARKYDFFRKFYKNGALMFAHDGESEEFEVKKEIKLYAYYKNGNLKKIYKHFPIEAEI